MRTRQGTCTIEALSPDDLLDAIRSIRGRYGDGVFVPAPGEGPEKLMEWAMSDILSAAVPTNAQEQARHATNAVINARRALSCLVDWYLRRDGFAFCKNAPKSADEKAEIMVRRGLIDPLTSRVLARAIRTRNEAEHEYQAIPVHVAEDFVELIRRTIQSIIVQSDPKLGPFVFGTVVWGHSFGENGSKAMFQEWSGPLGIIATFAQQPWIGAILPSTQSDATVRRLLLENVETDLCWMPLAF